MALNRKPVVALLVGAGLLAGPSGCRDLPGGNKEQGAVAGGVGGAVIGAVVAENRLLGALIGGAAGALGGYLIGANWDKITGNEQEEAQQAVQRAQSNPATPEQARRATTADINSDGFVTLDEVVAMKTAGFSDDEMLRRLRATNQIFELTYEQEQHLINQGVSRRVVEEMARINQDRRQQLLEQRGVVGEREVISRPR